VSDELQSSLGCCEVQFTLVDCPGHASLIRTIIGGVQIIDTMVLVIDITKGM
jgi:selenocysteine-specific elongation factor